MRRPSNFVARICATILVGLLMAPSIAAQDASASAASPQAKPGIHSATFHLYQEQLGTVGYGIDGRYTVRLDEVVVTIENGPVVAHQTVTLHSLRLGICRSSTPEGPNNIFSRELLLNDVSLKPHDSYKLPSGTIRIPLPKEPPARGWLCSTLLESNGEYHVARDIGPPIWVPSDAAHQGIADVGKHKNPLGVFLQTPSAPVVIKGGIGPVTFLRFSPNGGELARLSMFGPVALFDTTSYRKARTFSIGMRMVAYSPDGTKIATAEGRDGARVWDAAVPGKPRKASGFGIDEIYLLDTPLQVLQAPSAELSQKLAVTWAEFSPDGKRLITVHSYGPVKVWDTSSWAVEEEIHLADTTVRAAAFAPDGKTIVMGDASGTLHEWDVATKAWIDTWNAPAGSGVITGVVFSPDGNTLVTAHYMEHGSVMAMLWQNNSPARAGVGRGYVQGASGYSEPGQMLYRATGGWIGQVESGFGSAAFSGDGKLLALGGRHIKLIDAASWKQIRDIELPEMTRGEVSREQENQPNAKEKIGCVVTALAFSPDGSALGAGCSEGTVRLVKMTR